MVVISMRGRKMVTAPPPSYQVATGYLLVSIDEDGQYVYAGTHIYHQPPKLVRFLKSDGSVDAVLNLPTPSAFCWVTDIKHDSNYIYCRVSGNLLTVVRVLKSDFATTTVLQSAVRTTPDPGVQADSIGQMWLDSVAGYLYVPDRDTAVDCPDLWKISLAAFTSVGHLQFIGPADPAYPTLSKGVLGAAIGNATDIYASVFYEKAELPPFVTTGSHIFLYKVDKATFAITSYVFNSLVANTDYAMFRQSAIDAAYTYGLGVDYDGATSGIRMLRYLNSNIATFGRLDTGMSSTFNANVDTLKIDATKLYYQDYDSDELKSVLLSNFATVAVVHAFGFPVTGFTFDSQSFYALLQNSAFVPPGVALVRFTKP